MDFLAILLEGNGFQFPLSFCTRQFDAGKNLDAFAPENVFDFNAGIRIKLLQNMFAALEQSDFDSEARKKLCELAGNRATAEDDERLGQFFQRHGIIAGEIAGFIKLGQGSGATLEPVAMTKYLAVISLPSVRSAAPSARLGGAAVKRAECISRPTLRPTGQAGVRGSIHRMRIEKTRIGADEFEFSGVQLLFTEIGKILDLRAFPRHDSAQSQS